MGTTQIVNTNNEVILVDTNWKALRSKFYDMLIDGELPEYKLEVKNE